VWATAISPAHPEKKGVGALNVPVVCDGVLVRPGDLVVGDGDGVIVIPRERAAATVAESERRAAAEQQAAQRIEAGATLWELHDLDEPYRRLGVVEHAFGWDERHDQAREEGR
jgi:4-hydroxy-4-methyl-2-oxoglutarate aldolase